MSKLKILHNTAKRISGNNLDSDKAGQRKTVEHFSNRWGLKEVSIVPYPINFPERYTFYVPLNAVFFLTIYDDWGEKKLNMFHELGLQTEILWRCTREEKGLSSTAIRNLIKNGQIWKHLVPEKVVPILHQILSTRQI